MCYMYRGRHCIVFVLYMCTSHRLVYAMCIRVLCVVNISLHDVHKCCCMISYMLLYIYIYTYGCMCVLMRGTYPSRHSTIFYHL